ncbi:hypothetical protein Pyn_24656 [Prunus yedoensis var. nudiflora]|uniref:Uncharacterized protein n=1 Tax=Prunus yedoensis var. nudiflora TaxID=2094558 RepID=A0A314Y3E1_PRUYE|nr:hypothetical protein Pyn_24656 [Prunus yedoensis var. nudiflora]
MLIYEYVCLANKSLDFFIFGIPFNSDVAITLCDLLPTSPSPLPPAASSSPPQAAPTPSSTNQHCHRHQLRPRQSPPTTSSSTTVLRSPLFCRTLT